VGALQLFIAIVRSLTDIVGATTVRSVDPRNICGAGIFHVHASSTLWLLYMPPLRKVFVKVALACNRAVTMILPENARRSWTLVSLALMTKAGG